MLLITDVTIQDYCIKKLQHFYTEIVLEDTTLDKTPSLIIADLLCLNKKGFSYFQEIVHKYNQTPLVIISNSIHPCFVEKALNDGAAAFIQFPCSDSRFVRTMLSVSIPSKNTSENDMFSSLLGDSPVIKDLKQKLLCAAQQDDLPVLLLGDSGTGKSFAARLISQASARKKAFYEVNITALSETIIESELFGTSLGAFTGAIEKSGFFERAEKGTLFLDEIGDLPASIQVKLLHVIETGSFFKVGSTANLQSDVKLIFATNANLNKLLKKKIIREDFYFRIMQFPIKIPSLNERKEDIPLLAHSFAQEKKKFFSAGAIEKLCNHDWSGNVRELSNCVKYACLLCSKSKIDASDIVFIDREVF